MLVLAGLIKRRETCAWDCLGVVETVGWWFGGLLVERRGEERREEKRKVNVRAKVSSRESMMIGSSFRANRQNAKDGGGRPKYDGDVTFVKLLHDLSIKFLDSVSDWVARIQTGTKQRRSLLCKVKGLLEQENGGEGSGRTRRRNYPPHIHQTKNN